MFKKIILSAFILIGLTSCDTADRFNDMQDHWDRMDREDATPDPVSDKSSNDINMIKFALANKPDVINFVDDSNFDDMYQKLIKFMNKRSYKIIDNIHNSDNVVTIIARPNKEMPDYYYIGVELETNVKLSVTTVRVEYGDNKLRAEEFYQDYIETL
jgi:hypothetical protein